MPATTQRPTRRKAATAVVQPLPNPQLELNQGKLFWLACYFIDLNKADVLKQVGDEMYRRNRSSDVTSALSAGQNALLNEAKQSLRYALGDGVLLFAHPTTTIFNNQVVAQ